MEPPNSPNQSDPQALSTPKPDESGTPADNDGLSGESVSKYLIYTLSLPERVARAAGAMLGGAARESTSLLLPRAFQNAKTYKVMVKQLLDFLAEDVGGVQRDNSAGADDKVQNFVARKTVGNFIEIAGLATFHLSPLTFLAIVSDVAYGSQSYLTELAEELKKKKLIDESSTIHQANDFLAAVAKASSVSATTLDTPPLSLSGLQGTVDEVRKAVKEMNPADLIPQHEIKQMWEEMRQTASQQHVGLLELSSAVTMQTLRKVNAVGTGTVAALSVAGSLLNRHVIGHYASALNEIRSRGIYNCVSESCEPYLEAVWYNFAESRPTVTEDVVTGRLFGRLGSKVRSWFSKGSSTDNNAESKT